MPQALGDFEQHILFALIRLGDDAYGVTIRESIEARTGRAISPGALYTALDRLEQRGLVASRLGEPTPQRGGKRKRLYTLQPDRKSTRLNSSHSQISYAVFCLKKKKKYHN